MNSTHAPSASSLWVVTSYFNPAGFTSRLQNYRRFRARLPIPLLTVELSFDGKFELRSDDADHLIRLRDGDVMWQKERLLNVAFDALPTRCDKVVWLDCDTLVGGRDWADRVHKALDTALVIQPFARVIHLSRDTAVNTWQQEVESLIVQNSLAFGVARGRAVHDALFPRPDTSVGACTPGYAWAARREIVRQHGLYDGCITGGGDFAIACALYGRFDLVAPRLAMSEREHRHYLDWARRSHSAVDGKISWVAGDVVHLWHGAFRDRGYDTRYVGPRWTDFDPARDITMSREGCWRWNTHKPELHRFVRDYFATRNEDS